MTPDSTTHSGQNDSASRDETAIFSPTTERGIVGALFLLIALLAIFPMRDYDTFWYMANGRVLFETGEIVNRELFSYTAFGTPFRNIGWLGQYILYLLFRWGGPSGLIFFKTAITLLTSGILYRTGRMLGAARLPAALLMVLVVYAQLWRFVERPQIFTYLLLALLSMILHGWRSGKMAERTLWLVPALLLIWDLFHGSLYGFLLLLAVVGGETICLASRGTVSSWPGLTPLPFARLRLLYAAALLATVLLAVTPYGLLHGNLGYFTNLVNGATEAKYIGEYLPPELTKYAPFWSLIALTAISLLLAGRSLTPVALLIAIPFGALAMKHCRSIEAFGLVAYPLLAISMTKLSAQLKKWQPQLHKPLLILVIALFAVNLLHFKFVRQNYRYTADETIDDFSFRLGINENYFPAGSTRFIVENNVQGKMFNSDRFGGWLAYYLAPQRPIFHYNHPTIFKNLYGFLHNPRERQKFGVTYAIVGNIGEVDMFKQEGFIPVYREPAAMVMLKPTLENRDLIQRYAIKLFDPLDSRENLLRIAATPQKFLQLIIEIADYLAYRSDPRIAGIFAELLRTNAQLLSDGQRTELIKWASRYNAI